MDKLKMFIKQLFCRHKEQNWREKRGMFHIISGDQYEKYCLHCGKILEERFVPYE